VCFQLMITSPNPLFGYFHENVAPVGMCMSELVSHRNWSCSTVVIRMVPSMLRNGSTFAGSPLSSHAFLGSLDLLLTSRPDGFVPSQRGGRGLAVKIF
jgi:hypothetical protein